MTTGLDTLLPSAFVTVTDRAPLGRKPNTSAMLKLLVRETESVAIERELLTWSELATSVIMEVELPRAVAHAPARSEPTR